jgi:hypothetical protein
MAIQRIACLSCGGNSFTHNAQNHLVCDHCGSVFRTRENICSACNTVNPASALHCHQCGARLKRRCTSCGHDNPGNAEYCANCNNALDILEFISRRYAEEGKQDRQVLVETKRKDIAFVEEQSARLREIDEERVAALREQKEEQTRQERIMLMVVAGAAALVFLACIIIFTLTSLFSGG